VKTNYVTVLFKQVRPNPTPVQKLTQLFYRTFVKIYLMNAWKFLWNQWNKICGFLLRIAEIWQIITYV